MSFENIIVIIVQYLLLGLASEALAELIVDSEFSAKFRKPWKKWAYPVDRPPSNSIFQRFKVFVDELWSCGYCTSVWTSGFLALFVSLDGPRTLTGIPIINWVVATLVIHRLANWIHITFQLVKQGRVRTYDLLLKSSVAEDLEPDDGGDGQTEGEGQPEAD